MVLTKNKKALILIVWLLFMAVANVIFFAVESRLSYSRAKVELNEQAESILYQVPVILDNVQYCREESLRVVNAKVRGFALGLEKYETIEEALPFIEEYKTIAELSNVAIYDNTGAMIYADSEKGLLDDNEARYIPLIFESNLFTNPVTFEHNQRDPNKLLNGFMKYSDLFPASLGDAYWGVGKRWLVFVHTERTDTEDSIESFLSWESVFSRIRVGKEGSVLVISGSDEKVHATAISELMGLDVSELGIKTSDKNEISSYSALRELLDGNGDTHQLTINGIKYYAKQVGSGDTVILAILPVSEVKAEVTSASTILEMLLLLITGIGTMYAIFHSKNDDSSAEEATEEISHDPDEGIVVKPKKVRRWNRQLANKLKLIGMLSIIGVLGLGIYMEALSTYADTFDYSRTKVNNVVRLLDVNKKALEVFQKWLDNEYLVRARMAECLISDTDPKLVDESFLGELADVLSVRDLYIFDENGNLLQTNSDYNRRVIDETSPMHVVLEGRPYYITSPELDPSSGETLQMVGLLLKDQEGNNSGMLMLVADPRELTSISSNLGYRNIFEQVSLAEGSFVLAINGDKTIAYMASIEDGKYVHGFGSFDYTGMDISNLGIDEQRLRDNYNGNTYVLGNEYFASVRRNGDSYFLVMRPRMGIDVGNVLPVIYATVVTVLYMTVLVILASTKPSGSIGEDVKKTKHPRKPIEDDDVRAMMGNLLYKRKPYFEERWPNECRKWKEKTPGEKFQTSCGILLVFMLVSAFLHAMIAGPNSIWYYCIHGEWDSGVNLYSITTCVIATFALIMAKLIIHKLLFYIARAASPRGETVCDLLDSFTAYALFIVGIVIFLVNIGINLKTVTLTGGAIGVIFGIACKNVFDDILSGIIMTLEGVVHDGDLVIYNGNYGVVLNIGIRTTRLKWLNDITIVRNNDFKNFANKKSDETTRFTTTLTIDLNESLERVEAVINRELPLIEERIGMDIEGTTTVQYRGVESITLNGVVLSFAILVPGRYFGAIRSLNGELKLMCEKNGINLAMQQVVINQPNGYPSLQNQD